MSSTRSGSGFRFPYEKYDDPIALYANFRHLQNYLEKFLNTPTQTISIAAVDSSDRAKKLADFVCNGENDNLQVDAALLEIVNVGGEIFFYGGTYTFTSVVSVPAMKRNIAFRGEPGARIVASGTPTGFFSAPTSNSSPAENPWVAFERLEFDAGGIANVQGIGSESAGLMPHFVVRNCAFHDFSIVGNSYSHVVNVGGAAGTQSLLVEGCRFIGCTGSGAAIPSGGIVTARGNWGAIVVGNYFDSNNLAGNHYVWHLDTSAQSLAANNIIVNHTGNTTSIGVNARQFHNWIAGTYVAGDHTGVDHGGLAGLTDDDHTQYVLRSLLTAKGDLFVRDATGVVRLPVGADGAFLKADSADAEGLSWAEIVTDPLPQILMLGGM